VEKLSSKIGALGLWCIGATAKPQRQVLRLSVPRAQLVDFLKQKVKRLFGTYRGKITDDRFTVAVQHIWLNNPWFPLLHGKIEETADGCSIETHFDVPNYIKVFFACWLLLAFAFAVFGVDVAIFHARTIGYVFAGLPAYGILIARLGRHIGKNDELKLQLLLEEIGQLNKQSDHQP
jgi:hypothetical protein